VYRILMPLVFSLFVGAHGVAGPVPPSYQGQWYVWNCSAGDVYAPGRILMHMLENPETSTSPWNAASEEAIMQIAEVAKNDPLLKDPTGPLRYWLFFNEPDLTKPGDWRDDPQRAGYWYARAYHAVKQYDPYHRTRIGGPNLFDARGDGTIGWLSDFLGFARFMRADIEVYGVRDWWGRYEDYEQDDMLFTWLGLREHLREIKRANLLTPGTPIWVTETGSLYWDDPATAIWFLGVLLANPIHDRVDKWFWFSDPEWGPQGGRLWDDDWQLTELGRLWLSAN
jgi:hypothetical protein